MQRFERENGELLDYYKKLNKVREVDGNGTVEQVYKNIGHQLAPQIIFFFGAPATAKKSLAKYLAHKISYQYINFEEFFAKHHPMDEIQKVNHLITYLRNSPNNNFVFSSFFPSSQCIQIFSDCFAHPLRMIYLQASKDQIHDNIMQFY